MKGKIWHEYKDKVRPIIDRSNASAHPRAVASRGEAGCSASGGKS